MMCERCRAGQVEQFGKKVGPKGHETILIGRKCSNCGYTQLDSDDAVWTVVGLYSRPRIKHR